MTGQPVTRPSRAHRQQRYALTLAAVRECPGLSARQLARHLNLYTASRLTHDLIHLARQGHVRAERVALPDRAELVYHPSGRVIS